MRLGKGGEVQKFNDNLAAIRIVKALELEHRRATPEEQRQLARYVGWGGLPQAFRNKETGAFGNGWETRGKQLEDLLTKAELDAARATTTDAHYTSQPVVEAMWKIAQRLGFRGGILMEPSVGVGNFIGLMPESLRGNTGTIGIEVDGLTSRIAQELYPQASILNSGFEKVPLPDDAVDLVIGNPPFGKTSLYFPYNQALNGHAIHNQFFLGSMDALRPGGLQIMVVSRYLMDAKDSTVRRALSEQAELVAAIRLPDSAFKENARTEVVTDILILRKFDANRIKTGNSEPKWVGTTEVADPLGGEPITVNNYFSEHPEMMLGTLERSGSMRSAADVTLRANAGSDIATELSKAIATIPEASSRNPSVVEASMRMFDSMRESLELSVAQAEVGDVWFNDDGDLVQIVSKEAIGGQEFMTRRTLSPNAPWSPLLSMNSNGKWFRQIQKLDAAGNPVKSGRFNVYDREVFQTETDVPESLRLGETRFERLKNLITLRDLVKKQIVMETSDESPDALEAHRAKLKRTYEDYTGTHGFIADRRSQELIADMPDGPLVSALEMKYDPGISAAQAKRTGQPAREPSAEPAPIMSERVVVPYVAPVRAANGEEALSISLAESGRIDLDRMSKLLGKSEQDTVDELFTNRKDPLIFRDPETQAWETRDAYLSGKVVRKLNAAREFGLEKNVRALEAVQPEPIPASDIGVRIGSAWVPGDIYAQFVERITGSPATVRYSATFSTFDVQASDESVAAKTQWGTERKPASSIIDDMLNSRSIAVYDSYKDEQGNTRRVLNEEETQLANAKAEEVSNEFADWIMADPDRRERLANIYNQQFNNRVARQYDGQQLQLPGKVPDAVISMRRHQKNVIWRGISERNLLIDHAVGSGKTFSAIAIAMERRRMGLSHKPMITVPNHMVKQFATDVLRLYPSAKVLALGKSDMEAKRRRRAFSRISMGDWDVVIVPHSSFGFIGISNEREAGYVQEEIKRIESALKQAEAEGSGEGWRKPQSVKTGEALLKGLKSRMERIKDRKQDKLLSFEQLGVDHLTVDEAHEFKNLMYYTRLTKVLGLGTQQGSKKAYDLYNKVRFLRESPHGGINFMTGTPISNSIVEMYTLMRYLAANDLEDYGIENFDAWHHQFADAVTKFELNDANQLAEKTRLARWSNMPELMKLYYNFTDAVSMDDIKRWFKEDSGRDFPIPKVKGGKRRNIIITPTPAQEQILNQVVAEFNGLKGIGDVKARNATRLRLMDRARKVSLDARAVDPTLNTDEKGGKLEQISDQVVRIYHEWSEDKGTQLIFLDRSVPKSKGDGKIIQAYEKLQAQSQEALRNSDEEAFMEVQEALEKYDAGEIAMLRAAQRGGWNAYQQIKDNLVARGIPAAQIRFIQEANTDDQKRQIFDAVRAGDVRVLIGTTPRMGAGTNVQDRLVALHHADVNWKPSDIEQREGRIVRQGNLLYEKYGEKFEVELLAYATERTYDAKMWALNETKGRFINSLRSYNGEREVEIDDSESENMAEMAAMASGDPRMLERVQLDAEVKKLELQRRSHRRRQESIEDAFLRAERDIERIPVQIEDARADEATMDEDLKTALKEFESRSITIEGQTYTSLFSALSAAENAISAQRNGNKRAHFVIKINGEDFTAKNAADRRVEAVMGDPRPVSIVLPNGDRPIRMQSVGMAIADMAEEMGKSQEETRQVGTLLGLPLMLYVRPNHWNAGKLSATLQVTGRYVKESQDIGDADERGEFSGLLIANILPKLTTMARSTSVAGLEYRLKRAKEEAPELRKQFGHDFPKQAEYEQKKARLSELTQELTAEGKTVDSAFRINSDQDTGSVHGIFGWDQARRIVEGFVRDFPKAPRFVMVDAFADLPASIQQDADDQSGTANSVKGVFKHVDGKPTVYVVVGNHTNAMDFEATVFHEALGHAGVRAMFGQEFVQELNRIFLRIGGIEGLAKIMHSRGKDTQFADYVRGVARARGANALVWNEALSKALLTEEVFAHIAEDAPLRKLGDRLKTLLGYVRDWLREHGLMRLSNLGESDLLFMLSRARAQIVSPKNGTAVMRNGIDVGEKSIVTPDGKAIARPGDPLYEAFSVAAEAIGMRKQSGVSGFSMAPRGAAPLDTQGLRDAVAQAFPSLSKALDKMLERGSAGRRGGVVVIDSENPSNIAGLRTSALTPIHSDGAKTQGFYDQTTGLTYLVGPNLSAESAPGVLLHEITHSQQRTDLDAKAMQLIARRGKIPMRPAVREFLGRVQERMASAGAENDAREATAYIVEQAVTEGRQGGFSAADGAFLDWVDRHLSTHIGNLVREFVAMVRAWGMRHGVPMRPLAVDDLVAYAKIGLKSAAAGKTSNSGDGAYSRSNGMTRQEAREALAQTFVALSHMDDVFQVKASTSKRLQDVVKAAIPDAHAEVVDNAGDSANLTQVRIGRAIVTLDKGARKVWMNFAAQGEGTGGSAIYAAVGNWAANNGLTFIGDPGGVSETGKRRRLENVISLALKFPKLDVRLHPDQLAWLEDNFNVRLRLKDGDALHNLGEMLLASYAVNVKEYPELRYAQFDGDGFRDTRTGEAFDFDKLAKERRGDWSRGGLGTAGPATLMRAALARAVLQANDPQRGHGVLEALYALRDQSLPTPEWARRILYSRTPGQGDPGRGNGPGVPGENLAGIAPEQFRSALVDRFGEAGVKSLERQGLINLSDRGAANNPAWYENGRAYFDPRYIASREDAVAKVFHELGSHHALPGALGERGWKALKARIAMLAEGNGLVGQAWRGVIDSYPEFSLLKGASPAKAINSDRFIHEVVARLGETAAGRKHSVWRQIVGAAKAFLVKLGITDRVTDSDVATFVEGALSKTIAAKASSFGITGGRLDARPFTLVDYLRDDAGRTELRAKLGDIASGITGSGSARTFNWWNRTVGTQFQKAKQSPEFARVYNRAPPAWPPVTRSATPIAASGTPMADLSAVIAVSPTRRRKTLDFGGSIPNFSRTSPVG